MTPQLLKNQGKIVMTKKISVAAALRKKARIESKLSRVLDKLAAARTYFEDEVPDNIPDLIDQFRTLREELLELTKKIQEFNVSKGALELINRRDTAKKIFNALDKPPLYSRRSLSGRSKDDVVILDNPWCTDEALEALEDEYDEYNDKLQQLNAEATIEVDI
jgi:hypothetical protein